VGLIKVFINLRKKLKRVKKEYWLKQIKGVIIVSEV